ncbi:MAG: homoserine dehydrogenase [Candidatus Omnitrophota bacterium]
MKKINIGLIGFGNVGSGVVRILRERKAFLRDKLGTEINISKIADKDISSRRNVSIDRSLLTKDAGDVIKDPNIDIAVELIGGIHPAREFIIDALRSGKNIVTANKALLAERGRELFALAEDRGKNIYFEASVGAGIPIIKSLREGLVANRFESIFGIVNGTSNYILSEMTHHDRSFSEALRQAQAKGFAEKDPSLDIAGMDSAHKLVILTYLCFGRLINLSDVFVEGVSHISLSDVHYARELGFKIKLLAIAKKENGELEVRVHPTLIPESHLLSSVESMFNALYVSSDLAGELLFYGPGAGQLSAASAVVSDLVDLAQDIRAGLFRRNLNIVPDSSIKKLRRVEETSGRYYIRFMVNDHPGVLAKISGILARFGISIASVTQKERKKAEIVPIVMIIHDSKEKNLRLALRMIARLDIIGEKPVAIRMEEV